MSETRLNLNNRYMPQSQPQNAYVCTDASDPAVEANQRAIEEIIGRAMALALAYDGIHCSQCGAHTYREHDHEVVYDACPACGWVYAPARFIPRDDNVKDVPVGYRKRNYGPARLCKCGCGRKFRPTVGNKVYFDRHCRKGVEMGKRGAK